MNIYETSSVQLINFQELMAMREERSDLRAQLFASERERKAAELRHGALEASHRAAQAALRHLQAQLADTEALLSLARQNKVNTNVKRDL